MLKVSNFIKINPVGAELFHAHRRTNMTNLLVVLRNFAKAPSKGNVSSVGQLFSHKQSSLSGLPVTRDLHHFFFVLHFSCFYVCCSVIFAHPWRSTWYRVSYTTRLHPATTWVHLSFVCPFLFHNNSTVRVGIILQENCTPPVV